MLFRILCAFLDQGIAIDAFPVVSKPFMESIKEMEQNSFVSFFHTKTIRQKFISGNYSLRELLKTIVGKEEYFEQYLLTSNFRIMAGVVLSALWKIIRKHCSTENK